MRPSLNTQSRARRLFAPPGGTSVGAALGGCIGYEGEFERGYQVDSESLDKVKVGATSKQEALALLGTPSTTSTIGGDAWYYIGQKMQRSLAFMPAKLA